MKKLKYSDKVNAGAVATCHDTALSGWAIYDIDYDINDSVIAGYVTDSKTYPARRYKIQYSSGHCAAPYFRAYGRRLYLDVFMKTNRVNS